MKKILFLAVMALVVSACGSHSEQKSTVVLADTTKAVAMSGYQCPMKCEGDKTYDKPGECPACGMDMKDIAAKDHDHADSTKH
jgi:Heavy metal binding domain/Prokaryotic membrane lipoprotein lipid attachment site